MYVKHTTILSHMSLNNIYLARKILTLTMGVTPNMLLYKFPFDASTMTSILCSPCSLQKHTPFKQTSHTMYHVVMSSTTSHNYVINRGSHAFFTTLRYTSIFLTTIKLKWMWHLQEDTPLFCFKLCATHYVPNQAPLWAKIGTNMYSPFTNGLSHSFIEVQ